MNCVLPWYRDNDTSNDNAWRSYDAHPNVEGNDTHLRYTFFLLVGDRMNDSFSKGEYSSNDAR